MHYSDIRTDQYFIQIRCADKKCVYSDGGREYQLWRYYQKRLRWYGLKLITYSDGTFVIVDYADKLTGHITLRQVGRIIRRFKQYKRQHTLRQMHNYIDKLIEEALQKS